MSAGGTGRPAISHRTSVRARAWAELLRLPALFTVPGDALAGAAATAVRPNTRTLLAIGSSLCLYEAGMALNDWADREEDALERPHRPLPSGRIHPATALTAACVFTAGGLALAARAGRPALTVAAPLAATIWAYDLTLKHTPAGPAAMAAARGLDLLLGAAATAGHTREALPSAALLSTHTLAVTTVSRHETSGGSPLTPLAALATTAALTRLLTVRRTSRTSMGVSAHTPAESAAGASHAASQVPAGGAETATVLGTPRWPGPPVVPPAPSALAETSRPPEPPKPRPAPVTSARLTATDALRTALAAAYSATAARPYFHAALNPSPPLTQRAVGGGIRATIPLQAALAARSGAGVTALLTAAMAPIARNLARKVSVT